MFGDKNEQHSFLSDVIIFDLQIAHWTEPELHGIPPGNRYSLAAVFYDEKLYIIRGISGHGGDRCVHDDIYYLDLKA